MRLLILLLMAALLGLGLGLNSPSAQAHANLLRSDPAENAVVAQGPAEVQLWFSEAVDVKFSRVQVVDPSGKRYDNNDFHDHGDATNPGITLQPNLPPGTYTVVWNALSAVDGHRTAGLFAFSVGVAPPEEGPAATTPTIDLGTGGPPRWLSVFSRWLNFAAMAAFIGAVSFPLLILPSGLRAIPQEDQKAKERAIMVVRGSMFAALVVLLLATLLMLWLQTWAAGGSASSLSSLDQVLMETRFGEIWFFRIALVMGALVAVALLPRRPESLVAQRPIYANEFAWLLLIALAIPVTTSLNSHAAADQDAHQLRILIDWLHLVAGGFWIGGLLQLSIITPAVLSASDQRAPFLAAVIPRFSLLALASVGLIVTTGALQWWQQLGSVPEVVQSGYGYTLLAKVLLLLPLLALGAFNLLIVRPRFLSLAGERLRAALSLSLRWEGRFRLAVAAEVVLAVVILGVTAFLTDTSPPADTGAASASAGSLVQRATADDLHITLTIEPGRVGANDLSIFLTDANGNIRPVQRVIARFTHLEHASGTSEADIPPLHPNEHYLLNTSQLSLPGEWEIEVIVRREGLLDARTTFVVQMQT